MTMSLTLAGIAAGAALVTGVVTFLHRWLA